MEDRLELCRNCKTPLQGEYCAECGQREGRSDVQLSEVAGELADDFLHWDSRIWRTVVPLMVKPGFLTAEFIAGRKARYVPPLRLYLLISFALFLVMSLQGGNVRVGDTVSVDSAQEGEPGGDPEADASDDFNISFDFRPQKRKEIARAEEEGDTVIAPFVLGGEDDEEVGQRIRIDFAGEGSPQWLKDLDQRMDDNADRISADPGSYLNLIISYLPQMMFVLLPLFALLIKACYLFSPFHYLQHLVFSLHFHSFVYLLSLLGSALELLLPIGLNPLLVLLVLVYLPLALRRSYGSSVGGAMGKSLLVAIADLLLLVSGFVVASVLALLTM